MSCEEVIGLLPEYIGGGLPQELRGRIAEHLASCTDCRRETAFLLRLRRAPAKPPRSLSRSAFDLVRADAEPVLPGIERSLGIVADALKVAEASYRIAFACTGSDILGGKQYVE